MFHSVGLAPIVSENDPQGTFFETNAISGTENILDVREIQTVGGLMLDVEMRDSDLQDLEVTDVIELEDSDSNDGEDNGTDLAIIAVDSSDEEGKRDGGRSMEILRNLSLRSDCSRMAYIAMIPSMSVGDGGSKMGCTCSGCSVALKYRFIVSKIVHQELDTLSPHSGFDNRVNNEIHGLEERTLLSNWFDILHPDRFFWLLIHSSIFFFLIFS